jgi:hypothetical protein
LLSFVEVYFLLLGDQDVLVSLVERPRISYDDLLAELFLGWWWSQLFTEGGKLLL